MLYEVDPTAGYVVGHRHRARRGSASRPPTWPARSSRAATSGTARAEQAALVTLVGEVAHDVVAAAGLTWKQVAHTVVGGPGVFDPDSDRLRHAPNLPGWSRPGVMSSLREALPPTVTLDNDANLAAVGERTYGSGRDARNFVYVSVGTGIGMGIDHRRRAVPRRARCGRRGRLPAARRARATRRRAGETRSGAACSRRRPPRTPSSARRSGSG